MNDQPNTPVVICRCGAIIHDDRINYWNGCNEEGEDYGTVEAKCNTCHESYETGRWGEWEDRNEALECVKEYIKKGD